MRPMHLGSVSGKFIGWLAIPLGLLAMTELRAQEPALEGMKSSKVVVIPVRQQIAKPELFILRRGLKEAIEQNVDTIVLDMETPGGALNVTFEMLKALEKFPGKTITYVNSEAISAGALIAAGTDEIYFAPGSVIGAAAPVLATGAEIDATMRGKVVSYLKARVRSISEGKGYRSQVISAMIDMDMEFKIGEEVIKAKGELLSLTALEAMKTYGEPPIPLLGAGIAKDLDDLLNQIHGAGNYSVLKLEVTWSEKLAQYLTAITPLLIGVGLLLLFVEFKTPGFGIFGTGGIVVLALVFFTQFTAGLSGHEPALFFAIGLILVMVDLFFLPGLILAMVGGAIMFVSLVWSMADLWPKEPLNFSSGVLIGPLSSVLIGTLLAVVMFLGMLRFLPRGGLWGKMVLDGAVGGEPGEQHAILGHDADAPRGAALIGRDGVATTALFPSGQVEIAGRRYEARLLLGSAAAGTSVRVTATGEFGLTVEVIS